MTRLMYDGISPDVVPTGAQLYAGYVDGKWPDFGDIVKRFPGAVHVPIATNPNHLMGVVLDVEKGDATPEQAPHWCVIRRSVGIDPTIYCNESTWAAVIDAFHAAKVAIPHFWIARWGSDHSIPPGAVAVQHTEGADYDTSTVADHWPGIDPEDDMPYTPDEITQYAYAGALKAIQSQPGRDALANANMWWLQHCIDGTVPPGANTAQKNLILEIHAGLQALVKA